MSTELRVARSDGGLFTANLASPFLDAASVPSALAASGPIAASHLQASARATAAWETGHADLPRP